MNYALNLDENNRILSATFQEYAHEDAMIVETLPEGNVNDYLYVDGEFVYSPILDEEIEELPTKLDRIEAQVTYTAMMTDTLLEG